MVQRGSGCAHGQQSRADNATTCQRSSLSNATLKRLICVISKRPGIYEHPSLIWLILRPFVCGVCGKGFPQKTSLDTHMHGQWVMFYSCTHAQLIPPISTGSTPHACRYNCGMWFKDPARRHRHMVDEHQYVPRQSKKKHTNGQPQDLSDFESVQQWNVGSAP